MKINIEKSKGRFWVFKAEPLHIGVLAEDLGQELKMLGFTKDDIHFGSNIDRDEMNVILSALI